MTKLPTGRHTQAIKSAKQDIGRYKRNRSRKSEAKTAVRNARQAASEDRQKAEELYLLASKKLDKAVSKKAIHKNKAARIKSRIKKEINSKAAQK